MKITKRQLRRIIREVTNRDSIPLENNAALDDAIEQIEHELYKEFSELNHDDAIARITSVIEEEYMKAAQKTSQVRMRHSDIT